MESEAIKEMKSPVQKISYAIIIIFFLYIVGCIILWVMSEGLENNHVMYREPSTGLGYCLIHDEAARGLVDFYNAYNVPKVVYVRMLENETLITIFISLIIISIVMWMRSSSIKPETVIEPAPETQTLKTQIEKTRQISPVRLERYRRDFTDLIILDLGGNTKSEIFSGIVKFALDKGLVKDGRFLYDSLSEKDSRGTSGIGDGIALPEAAFVEMSRSYAFIFCRTKDPVDFDSLDGIPVRILLVSLKSDKINFLDLKPMSRILQLIKSDDSRRKIMDAKTEDDIYDLWDETIV